MLKRLGAVAWWLGAIVIATAGCVWVWNQIRLRDCPAVIELSKQIDATHDAAVARYQKEHDAKGDKLVAFLQAEGDVANDPRDTESFREVVIRCQRDDSSPFVLFAGLATLVLWSLAFVLGGSFWLPPKTKLPRGE